MVKFSLGEIIFMIAFIFVLLLFFTGIFVPPYYEARLYERATGIHATYWEAFWCDLDESGHLIKVKEERD